MVHANGGDRVSINIPKWLYAAIVAAVLHAGYLTLTLETIKTRLSLLDKHDKSIQIIREEQLKRTSPVYSVQRLEADLRALQAELRDLRAEFYRNKTPKPE